MKPIFRWTLWQRRWSIFWWCIGIIFFVFLTLIFYPTIHSQSTQLNKSLGTIPHTARQLFTDTNDFFSPVGYLSSQMFYLLMPLLLSILSISLGMSLIGREERDNTIEMLLARPVSRTRLLIGKAAAGLAIVVIVTVISTVFATIMCRLVNLAVPSRDVLQAGAAAGLMSLTFGALAYLLSALGRSGRAIAIGLSAVYGLGGYILVSLVKNIDWLRWPAKIFPFNYYHSSDLLTGSYNWADSLFFVTFIIVCLALSWLTFRRRDISGS